MIAKTYISSYFIFDALSCVPLFVLDAVFGFSTDPVVKQEHIQNRVYSSFLYLKILKMVYLTRLKSSAMFIEMTLKDIFIY